jgi:hypothetical protein
MSRHFPCLTIGLPTTLVYPSHVCPYRIVHLHCFCIPLHYSLDLLVDRMTHFLVGHWFLALTYIDNLGLLSYQLLHPHVLTPVLSITLDIPLPLRYCYPFYPLHYCSRPLRLSPFLLVLSLHRYISLHLHFTVVEHTPVHTGYPCELPDLVSVVRADLLLFGQC